LHIGTAAPEQAELAAAPHHFIGSHSVFENFNASEYEKEATALLEKLFQKHRIVLLAGGSMLYIDAVCKGIDQMPDPDPEIRETLKKQWSEVGIESLRRQLKRWDPVYYREVDLKNPARIIHALEICLMTGNPYSSFRSNPQKSRPFNILKIALNCDREELHRRINARVDRMVEAGLEAEAREFYPQRHLNALNTVGYREFFAFFDGKISREEAIERIKRNTRRYARKQLTWFRKDPEMNWFSPGEENRIIAFIEQQTGVK